MLLLIILVGPKFASGTVQHSWLQSIRDFAATPSTPAFPLTTWQSTAIIDCSFSNDPILASRCSFNTFALASESDCGGPQFIASVPVLMSSDLTTGDCVEKRPCWHQLVASLHAKAFLMLQTIDAQRLKCGYLARLLNSFSGITHSPSI